MPVTRINEFQAREGQSDAVKERLLVFVPLIAASAGCRSCQLLQAEDDPTRIVVIEVWDSASAHQASLKGFPAEVFVEFMKLLVAPPTGRYYRM
ncbi:MAG TPA: antibiotic biosynthesis monooxygenase family protein [Gemmata sp.]|jgi:quinol monooxygenase YgiN|nr:antibiotic biosynthesis monooxygenase family protein [Gemmata sp.]